MSNVSWHGYHSALAPEIERYLASKRAMGCKFANEDRTLRLFDRYLTTHGTANVDEIDDALIGQFLASRQRTNARSHNHLLGVVRRLFEWLVDQQDLPRSPVKTRARRENGRALPFLYQPDDIRHLLAEAAQLPDNSRARLRGPTYATLFAILAGVGMRVGEVARLTCGDVDLEREVLQIRDSKFGKSRLVPFGPRLAERIRAYLDARVTAGFPSEGYAPLFSWNGTTPISTNSIRNTFRDDLLPHLGLEVPKGTAHPCVHGLRHTFAVGTLLRWYRAGESPTAKLNYLSTFLGHVNVSSTAVYLSITRELLDAANARFASFAPRQQERSS